MEQKTTMDDPPKGLFSFPNTTESSSGLFSKPKPVPSFNPFTAFTTNNSIFTTQSTSTDTSSAVSSGLFYTSGNIFNKLAIPFTSNSQPIEHHQPSFQPHPTKFGSTPETTSFMKSDQGFTNFSQTAGLSSPPKGLFSSSKTSNSGPSTTSAASHSAFTGERFVNDRESLAISNASQVSRKRISDKTHLDDTRQKESKIDRHYKERTWGENESRKRILSRTLFGVQPKDGKTDTFQNKGELIKHQHDDESVHSGERKSEFAKPRASEVEVIPAHRSPAADVAGTGAFRERAIRKKSLGEARRRRVSSSSTPQSPTDTIAIQCTKVPPEHNNSNSLRRHFSRFGDVVRVRPNVAKDSATVHFTSTKGAALAKEKGKNYFGAWIHIYSYKPRVHATEKSPLQQATSTSHSNIVKITSRLKPSFPRPNTTSTAKLIKAQSDVEKLAILDKIDKLLRSRTVKQSNLATALVSVGTCPDMCPEKERYLRSQKNLLSFYEMDERRKIDHTLVVKEYSRSSADQEEPLAHELRPSSVLRITMDYLITHFMRNIDYEHTAEWYDFLWNRTRAIRKEISIQQINDPFVIEVTEECARFHVCCAHELCEVDVSNFDPKINNENLEKTMKTVLDMYRDTRVRNPNWHPPNEAEFRAYFILLNINRSSDVLREVKEMPTDIRYSEQVRLSISAFSALHSSNYSRFFAVVTRATYLQAALLHRYFAQVRHQAIRIMARAYSSKAHTDVAAVIPVDDVIRMLLFNDVTELTSFCISYGIECDAGYINLYRGVDYTAESVVLSRSRMISSKMIGPDLSDVISNGRQPSPAIHTPSSSFDEHGNYIGPHSKLLSHSSSSAAPMGSTTVSQLGTATQSSGPVPSSADTQPEIIHQALRRKGISNEIVKYFAKILFVDVISEATNDIAEQEMRESRMLAISDHLVPEVLHEVIDKSLRTVVSDAILDEKMEIERKLREAEEEEKRLQEKIRMEKEEERKRQEEERRKEEEERRRKEKEECIERSSQEISLSLTDDVVRELISEDSSSTYKEELISHLSAEFADELMTSSTRCLAREIALRVFKEERKMRHNILRSIFKGKVAAIKWRKWRAELEKIRLYRRTCELFPSTSLPRGIHQQIRTLLPHDTRNEGERLAVEPLSKLAGTHARLHGVIEKRIPPTASVHYDVLPLNKIAFDNLVRTPTDERVGSSTRGLLSWKVVLGSPTTNEGVLMTWLQHKFGFRKPHSPTSTKESMTREFFTPVPGSHPIQVLVSCKMFEEESDCDKELFGASSLILLLTTGDRKSLIELQCYIKKILFSLRPIPPLPLLLLTSDPELSEHDVNKELGISSLPGISSFRVLNLSTDDFTLNCRELMEGTAWLASSSIPVPDLRCARLNEFVEDQLLNCYVMPLYRYMGRLEKQEMRSLDPYTIREVYNKVLEDICECLTEPSLQDISWPAPEFVHPFNEHVLPHSGWNSLSRLSLLEQIFVRMQLPEFPPLHSCDSIGEVQEKLKKYCQQVCPARLHLAVSIGKSIDSFAGSREIDDVDTLIHCFPWQRLVDAIASSLLEDVLSNKHGCLIIGFWESSPEKIQLPEWFDVEMSKLEFNYLGVEENVEQLALASTNSTCTGSRTQLTRILKSVDAETPSESCDWFRDDDVTKGMVEEVSTLQEEVETSVVESRQFEEDLERILERGDNFLKRFL